MTNPANVDKVYAILLAAGSATRYGGGKQTAAWLDSTLVRHASNLAASCCAERTILVTGHDWTTVKSACDPLSGGFVVNENYADGVGSSIAQAVRSVRHAASAVLVMLADQPLVTSGHLANLVATWTGGENEIVASAYAGTVGVPALFGAGCFADLCALSGDQGARKLLLDPKFDVQTIAFEDAAADVDTSQDLVRIARNARS
ncbi:MAG: nucleotidyltransferase family protein [Woeseiaceae bacterium]